MKPDKIMAKVGAKKITSKDMEHFLNEMDPQRAAQLRTQEAAPHLLEELIHMELLHMDAEDRCIDQEEEFLLQMQQIKERMLKQYAISHLLRDIQISEQEVKQYYKDHKEQYENPVSIKASHILVKEEKTAKDVYEQIQSGTSFEEAAKSSSTCEGVDLGYFTKGKMVQEFEDVSFSLLVDQISEPVKTPFGYHIIKVYDRQIGKSLSFSDVKQELMQSLLSQKQEQTFKGKINQLSEKYGVERIN